MPTQESYPQHAEGPALKGWPVLELELPAQLSIGT